MLDVLPPHTSQENSQTAMHTWKSVALVIFDMVDHAEYLIGVFDNQKKLRSGTAQTVNYALHQGKVITLIHPDTMEITAPAP